MKVDPELMLLVESAGVGDSEPDLGAKLMRAFLSMLLEGERLPGRCVFMASGVFLTTQGSPVQDLLEQYAAAGAQVLSCGTCLDYYDRSDKLVVGEPTTMRDTVQSMLSCQQVIRP